MAKLIRGMFYCIFAVFGGLCGYNVALQSQRFYNSALVGAQVYQNFAALILLGILVGVVLAPILANLMVKSVDAVAVGLQKLSLQEVLMGSAGLLFGLIVAFFVNLALQSIDFSKIPFVGDYLGPFLIVLTTVFFSFLGAFFGSRLVFIHSFRNLLETGTAAPWGRAYYILDTSVIIDGRICDVCEAGFMEGTLVVPQFVLNELQKVADSEDPQKRTRGRRGLDILHKMKQSDSLTIEKKDFEETAVDAKLIRLAQDLKLPLVTTDYNLHKVASLQNIRVLNINELASALKPVVLPGEEILVKLIRDGKEAGQGVGFLEDGTMVVVEKGRRYVGDRVIVEVTSIVQTNAGKMVFGRFKGLTGGVRPNSGPSSEPAEEPRESPVDYEEKSESNGHNARDLSHKFLGEESPRGSGN